MLIYLQEFMYIVIYEMSFVYCLLVYPIKKLVFLLNITVNIDIILDIVCITNCIVL